MPHIHLGELESEDTVKLYIVEFGIAWDGSEVAGIYSTRESAENRANLWSSTHLAKYYYTRITETEVDRDIVEANVI